MSQDNDIFQADVFDEHRRLSLDELCQVCGTQTSIVIEMVEEGVLEPTDVRASQWVFSGTSVRRVQTAVRLQRDLEVNMPGIALALELLDELETLRAQLRRR